MSRDKLPWAEQEFGNLASVGYRKTSDADTSYNCVAWAAGKKDKWWQPPGLYGHYWPKGIPVSNHVSSYVMAFQSLGYIACNNQDMEAGIEKVAIFCHFNGAFTHVCRQLDNGRWTSKLGTLEDIEHHTLNAFESSIYGVLHAVMQRKKS